MNERDLENLKATYTEYLSTLSIGSLRSVGRREGVTKSTLKKKNELIGEIVAVLSGEVPPAERTNRGAPVKDDYIDPKILAKLEEIRFSYLSELPVERTEEKVPVSAEEQKLNVLDVCSPDYDPQQPAFYETEVHSGQLETLNGVSCLLPVNCRDTGAERIIVTVSQIRAYDLREGDIVACRAEKHHAAFVASEILSINGLAVGGGARSRFEDCDVSYPGEKIRFYRGEGDSDTMKYLDWLIPFGKGQRTLLTASPKAGKTVFLKEIAEAILNYHSEIRLLVLLTDQSPEVVGEFKKIMPKSDFVYTTFDDDAQKHVFAADFLLKRAKRFAETGMDVFVLVDSLTNLAHAYNETGAAAGGRALGCGLESRTIHYLRTFFGAARRLDAGGSLSMFAAASVGTGNPMDEILASELFGMTNAEIQLSDELTAKRISPAVKLSHSFTKRSDLLLSQEELDGETFIRTQYLPLFGDESLYRLVAKAATPRELYQAAETAVREKIGE